MSNHTLCHSCIVFHAHTKMCKNLTFTIDSRKGILHDRFFQEERSER